MTLPTRAVSHHQLAPRDSPKTVSSYPTFKPPPFYRNMAPFHDEALHLQTMKFYVVHKLWHKITKLRWKIGTAGTCTRADFNQRVSWVSWGMGNIFLELIILRTGRKWFSILLKSLFVGRFCFFSHKMKNDDQSRTIRLSMSSFINVENSVRLTTKHCQILLRFAL